MYSLDIDTFFIQLNQNVTTDLHISTLDWRRNILIEKYVNKAMNLIKNNL